MKFNKTIIAASLAAAGLATHAAHAQSKVELYGIIDVGVKIYNNAPDGQGGSKTVSSLASGNQTPSRWGLRGSEDLGGGLKAVFQLEGGFNAATGRFGDSSRLFNRVSMVGLAGKWGQIGLGRQYSTSHSMITSVLPLGVINYEMPTYFSVVRADNSVTYTGKFDGLTVGAYYTFRPIEEQTTYDENTTGRFGFAASYDIGKQYRVIATYDRVESAGGYPNTTITGKIDNIAVGGKANFGEFAVSAVYRYRKTTVANNPNVKSHLFTVGGTYKVTPALTMGVAYTIDKLSGTNDVTLTRVGLKRTDDRWQQFAFLASYALSKRTNLYAELAHARKGAVALGLGADGGSYDLAPNKSNQTAAAIGIRHYF